MDKKSVKAMNIYRSEGDILYIFSEKDGINIDTIHSAAYAGRTDIRYVWIQRGIRVIGKDAFKDCVNLRDVIIPDTVTEIASSAFEGCVRLGHIDIPDGVKILGDRAFAGCSSMSLEPLPGSLENIGKAVFAGCRCIECFEFKEKGRYSIRKDMIYDDRNDEIVMYPCGSLDSEPTLPDTARVLRDGAFEGFRGTTIYINSSMASVTAKAFADCPELEDIYVEDNELLDDSQACLFENKSRRLIRATTRISRLNLDDILTIDVGAFNGCNDLKKVSISKCSSEADLSELSKIPNLRSLVIDGDCLCGLPFDFVDRDGNRVSDFAGHSYIRDSKGCFIIGKDLNKDNEDDDYDDEDWFGNYRDDKEGSFKPVDINGVTFDDIAGMQKVKDEIYERLILPNKEKELFESFGIGSRAGVLLYGPPGTGKTMLARAVASELDAAFFSVRPSDIMGCWVGDEEKHIRQVFTAARKHPSAVIFFDDFDALGKMRGDSREPWCDRLMAELLIQMQGVETYDGTLLVMAATNRPWMLDSALMRSGRFSSKILVPLPDRDAREWIFRNRLSKVPHSDNLDYRMMADATKGYSGADVEEVCNKAKIMRVIAVSKGDKIRTIIQEDVARAIKEVPSSVIQKDVDDTEYYSRTGMSPCDPFQYRMISNPRSGRDDITGSYL